MSSDTELGLKFALDLLNRDSARYEPRMLDDYTGNYTLLCNLNRRAAGGAAAAAFTYPMCIADLTLGKEEGTRAGDVNLEKVLAQLAENRFRVG